MENIFDSEEKAALDQRIDALQPDTRPLWGKMNAAQMLAHNSLVLEGALDDSYPTLNPVVRWIANKLIRGMVVGDRPYKRNTRTIPEWVVADERDFAEEKARILKNLDRVHALGVDHFEGKANPTFGRLTAAEWNRVFSKHLNHHLAQFGV